MNINVSDNTVHIGAAVDSNAVHINTGKPTRIETYTGSYDITPKSTEQTLDTQYKRCYDDIKVREIPVHSVSNIQGGNTVTIG